VILIIKNRVTPQELIYSILLIAVVTASIIQNVSDRRQEALGYRIEHKSIQQKIYINNRPEKPGAITNFVCSDCPASHNHAASIVPLPNDDILAVWYGGTREGAKDVSIYKSTYSKSSAVWSAPTVLLDRKAVTKSLGRYIKKLGNTVVIHHQNQLWIFFVTVATGGWSGSSINFMRSDDQGKTWSKMERLITSPFFNVSTLVRTKPLGLSGGRVGLPAYHELAGKYGEYMLVSPDGKVLDKTRISWGKTTLQPTIVSLGNNTLVAYMRNTARHPRLIFSATSIDGGKSWNDRKYISLPNPDAAISAIRDDEGRLLIALNNTKGGRRDMSLAVSTDNGSTWTVAHRFDYSEKKGAEFSYPSLIQSSDGSYHLVYTWHRKRIKHVTFNRAWLNSRIAEKKRR